MESKSTNENPRIYVACLAAYNNGKLHGAWIDANQNAEGIFEKIKVMLKASPEPEAEEFAIHDYEGFEGASIEEYQSIESIVSIAEFIVKHGQLGGKLINYFGDLKDAKIAIEDHYAGVYTSLADFARVTKPLWRSHPLCNHEITRSLVPAFDGLD